MPGIFLSYASADRDIARRLASALSEHGETLWWDRHLSAGQKFAQVIAEQLSSASCVLVLWSRASVNSDWVIDEATEGKRRGVLVPALIENIDLPIGFRQTHTANLVQWASAQSDDALTDLLAAIRPFTRTKTEITASIQAPPRSAPTQPRGSERGEKPEINKFFPLVGAGALSGAILLVTLVYVLADSKSPNQAPIEGRVPDALHGQAPPVLVTEPPAAQQPASATPVPAPSSTEKRRPEAPTQPTSSARPSTRENELSTTSSASARPARQATRAPEILSSGTKFTEFAVTYQVALRSIEVQDSFGKAYICEHPLYVRGLYNVRTNGVEQASEKELLVQCVTSDSTIRNLIDKATDDWNRTTPTFGHDWMAPDRDSAERALEACIKRRGGPGTLAAHNMTMYLTSPNSDLIAFGRRCSEKETGKRNSTDEERYPRLLPN